ncbi:MAG: sulfurtransferase [Labilithrix sp.]
MSESVGETLNVAAYWFVGIDDVPSLRARLLARTEALGLKGTILVATEGINLSLAGPPEAVRAFVAELHADPRFSGMDVKESWSATQPFRRMLVKEREEIIRMAAPAIRPDSKRADGRAPGVDPRTLERWLDRGHDDAGRPIVLLDTRNAFEVDQGTFEGAIDWRIERFTQFPAALAAHRAELVGKTVVSFCTGGIRCEKAAILMREEGIADVVQLEGGILRYFEVVGGAHYRGTCYVFDRRRALDPALEVVPLNAGPAAER